MSTRLILYSKPGCHLCEGLQEKLTQIQSLDLDLDVRDITTRDDWFQAYQYEIPVLVLVRGEERGVRGEEAEGRGQKAKGEEKEDLGTQGCGKEVTNHSKLDTQNSKLHPSSLILHPSSLILLPRPSPRATVQQLEQMLQKYL